MADLSRSVPSASRLLAESVRAYRAGFPGIARAFLPVFAIFAIGQIGLTLWGEAATFGGLIARALALAGIGVVEILAQALATGGLLASADDLPRATAGEIYRRGARVFWPCLWVTLLLALALSVVPALALALSPVAARVAASAAAFAGGSLAAAVSAAFVAIGFAATLAIVASFVVLSRLVFALPLAATGAARGLASLETSAGLSDGRAWKVVGRLAAGALATALATAPFALVLAATAQPSAGSIGSPWAWSLFAAGYLLVSVPFACVFVARLLASLRDTAAERAMARGPRPWVRAAAWAGAAAWVVLVARGISF